MDIVRAALEDGRRRYSDAHFVHYNRYHSEYNPEGNRYEPVPDRGLKFDYILPFSVFTHVHRNELIELVGQLRSMLAPDGMLAFTFTDPSYDTGLSLFPSGRYMLKLLMVLRQNGFLSLLVHDRFAKDPTWDNIELIMKQYAVLYPVMMYLGIDLGDRPVS